MSWRYVIEFYKGQIREVGNYKTKKEASRDLARNVAALLTHGIAPAKVYLEKKTMRHKKESHPESWNAPEGLLHHEDIQEILNRGCEAPGCTHDHSTLIMHSRCHFNAPTIVVFLKDRPYLLVACDVCKKPLAFIAIASRPPESEQTESL
jgi:hypothetical protein